MARVLLCRWPMKYAHEQPRHAGTPAVDVQTLLLREHAQLETLFEELVTAFRAGDREESAALWTAFESDLEAHMALEEKLILPDFAKVDAGEAAALAREHAAIRTSLSELGVGVDLHCTNLDAVDAFIRLLKAHAKRENALMYRWTRENLREGVEASMRPRLLGGVRKLLRNK